MNAITHQTKQAIIQTVNESDICIGPLSAVYKPAGGSSLPKVLCELLHDCFKLQTFCGLHIV